MSASIQSNDSQTYPGYLALLENGELESRVKRAYIQLEDCDLCPRYCHVNRREGIKGAVSRTGERAVVHNFGPHHSEEDPIRGWNGSGTVFFRRTATFIIVFSLGLKDHWLLHPRTLPDLLLK